MEQTDSNTLYINLLQLFFDNRDTLRDVKLYHLQYSGLNSLSIFLNVLSLCTNLVQLDITRLSLPADDTKQWVILGNNLKYLIVLDLNKVTLHDTGLKSLCAGLAYHSNIMKLTVTYAKLTSLSCYTLIKLIPTIMQLETLNVNEIKKPFIDEYKLLQRTTEVCFVKLW